MSGLAPALVRWILYLEVLSCLLMAPISCLVPSTWASACLANSEWLLSLTEMVAATSCGGCFLVRLSARDTGLSKKARYFLTLSVQFLSSRFSILIFSRLRLVCTRLFLLNSSSDGVLKGKLRVCISARSYSTWVGSL